MKRKSWLVPLMLGACLLANSQLVNAEENQSFGIEEDPTPVVDQPIPAATKRTALPQTFDPRNGDDAPVKDQNPRNVCWTFAATGALESALFKQTGEVVDFSERYFDYLSAHNATGVANSNPYSTGRALNTGGQEYYPLFSVTRWQGPVLEEDMPFINDVNIPFVTLDQLEVESDFHMQGMVALPKLGRGYSKEALAGKVTRMKEQIMTTTALTYQWSSACHKDSKYYNNAKAAYFVPQEATNKVIDHSSLIVGWDDHYSKENFGENKPENDGAFIVRNSWNTWWGDQGYYYVSYEDYYIATSQMYGASQIESVDNYDTQYTHTDFYSYHTSTLTTQSTDHYTMANVYELEGEEEELTAVGFQTMHYDVPYEIFVNPKGDKITNLNELVKVGEGVKKNPGIETFKLDQGIILSDTDKFAVVIRMVRPEGVGKFEILLESSYASPNKVSDYGQSYISSDPSRTSIRYTDTQSLAFANIYVDAYTDKRVAVESVKITPEKLELVAGDEKQLQAEFTPEEATNKKVSWTSSNPEIASVDDNGKVTGIKEGSATITMTTESGNKQATTEVAVKGLTGVYGTAPWEWNAKDQILTFGSGVFPEIKNSSQEIKTAIEDTALKGIKIKKIVFSDNVELASNSKGLFKALKELEAFEGLEKVNTDKTTNMGYLFSEASALKRVDLTSWNTGNVTEMARMFANASSLEEAQISNWNTENVYSMDGMFLNCIQLSNIDVSAWQTGELISTNYMFSGCSSITSLDLSTWEVKQLFLMDGMFDSASALTELNVNGWRFRDVEGARNVFANTTSLKKLDISSWNLVEKTGLIFNGNYRNLFSGSAIEELTIGADTNLYQNMMLPEKQNTVYTGKWIGPTGNVFSSSSDLIAKATRTAGTYTREKR